MFAFSEIRFDRTTTLIRVAAGLCDVAMVLRWNIPIGLSDKAS